MKFLLENKPVIAHRWSKNLRDLSRKQSKPIAKKIQGNASHVSTGLGIFSASNSVQQQLIRFDLMQCKNIWNLRFNEMQDKKLSLPCVLTKHNMFEVPLKERTSLTRDVKRTK